LLNQGNLLDAISASQGWRAVASCKIIPYESFDMAFVFHMKVLKDRKKNPKKLKKKKPFQPPFTNLLPKYLIVERNEV
jgi:hypothetical protein